MGYILMTYKKILLIGYDLFIPIFADKHCDEFFKVKNRAASPRLSALLTLLKNSSDLVSKQKLQ